MADVDWSQYDAKPAGGVDWTQYDAPPKRGLAGAVGAGGSTGGAEAWARANPNEPPENNPYLPGFGTPSLPHLWRDVQDRRRQAGEALDQAVGSAVNDLNPFHAPADEAEAQRRAQSATPTTLGLPAALQNVAGAALGLIPGVPEIAAVADTVAGRPVEAATGIPAQWTGNLVSAAVPIGGQAAAEAGLARAAAEAGLTVEGYQAMIAQQQAAVKFAAAAKKAGMSVDDYRIALAQAARAKAAKPPGPVARAVAPIVAAAPWAGPAEAQAAARLEAAASDPAAVRASLAGGPDQLVPGSQPTTFQQSGDLGLGSLEREARTRDPAAYQQRTAEQNAARQDAMPNPGGNVSDVASAVKQHLDDIDAQTQAAVEAATARASGATEGLGGAGTPDASGAALRQTITDAEQAARAAEGRLWTAVDPEGKLTGNVTATRNGAVGIRESEPPTAQPPSTTEAAIFDTAANLPDVVPVRNLTALRSWLSTAMREELLRNGRSPSYGRMSRLRGVIQDNLANSIGEAVQTDQQLADLQARVDAIERPVEARAAVGGDTGQSPLGAASVNSGPTGTAVSARGQPSAAPRGEGLPGEPQPNIDPGYADRLKAATEATKERARTFGIQPVSNVTATRGQQGDFRLPDGQVPGAVFRPGPGGFDRVTAAIKAGGDRAQQVIEDYAAQSLRRVAQRNDGSIDPAKFAAWSKAHQDALRALPEAVRARFANAADAGRAVDEAALSRATALKAANAGTLGKILGVTEPSEITRIVGAIFGKADSVTQMKALVARLRGNPEALAGLRQAVADHITQTFIGNTEAATSGTNLIKADGFQSFVRKNSGALRVVFSPEELANLHAIAADINRAKRSENALKLPGQSNTAQDTHALAAKAAADGKPQSMLDVLGSALGAGVGAMVDHGVGGAVGGSAVGGALTHALQLLRARGIATVDALVNRALLDPAFARTLLAKAPVHRAGTTALDVGTVARTKAIERALVAGELVSQSQPDQR